MIQQQTRYPGTQSFTADQRNIFFGRDNDIERLTEMIEMERMVLVYARSGIGKTSLINAGVLPRLAENGNYTFRSVRFGAYTQGKPSPHNLTAQQLKDMHNPKNYLDKIVYNDSSLWYYAKQWQLQQTEPDQTLLLVLDQFEELFTFPDEQVEAFKQDLAELLFTNVPQRFTDQKELLDEITPGFLTPDEEKLLYTTPKVKILFAIRSDRMSQLNNMSDYIPRILLKHYELSALNKQQATEAICKPAQMDGNFSSPKFTFHQQALNAIMHFLTKEGKQENNVESFQLQILCQVVERRVKNENLTEILAAHVEPVKDIYQNFYENLMQGLRLSEDMQLTLRLIIEDGLIEEATQRRLQLSGEEIELRYKVKRQTLDLLVNERLLRADERDEYRLYELSHDTLVAPILESRKIRVEKEEEARAEAERQEELRKAKEKAERERIERQKERKRQRMIIAIVSVAAVVAVALAVFGFWQMNRADRKTEIAEKEKQRSDSLYNEAQKAIRRFEQEARERKKAQINNLLQKANSYISFDETELAVKTLRKAMEIDSTNEEVIELLRSYSRGDYSRGDFESPRE